MEEQCRKIYEEGHTKIIKCDKNYFLVTGGKRLKMGPVEGETHTRGVCGCKGAS